MRDVDQQLLYCAGDGDLNGVISALDTGADINIQDGYDRTALMWAVLWGKTETADWLIQAGADPFIKNKWGSTASDIARKWGNTQIAKLIERMAERKRAELARGIEGIEIHDMSRWL